MRRLEAASSTLTEDEQILIRDADGDGVPDLFADGARRPRTTATAGGDAAGRLTELKGLRDAGLFTEQEYEAKKAEILSEL